MAARKSGAPRTRRRSKGTGLFSPLMRRILAVNVIALAALVGGILYLNQFRDNLIARRMATLATQGEIIAGAIGEAAAEGPEAVDLNTEIARQVIARLVGPTDHRARLFANDGSLLVDSQFMGSARQVYAVPLPPLNAPTDWQREALSTLNALLDFVGERPTLARYQENAVQDAGDYIEVLSALGGDPATQIRQLEKRTMILSVAVPVQRFRRVLGALMLTTDTSDIEEIIRSEQITILRVFAFALGIGLLLSIFLGGTIVRPIRKLARAAERVRRGIGREEKLPEFLDRRDEIGDLSLALNDMTEALYRQLDAVEAFAADVAHELKNPLTSLRSAIETQERSQDPEHRRKLLEIMKQDVQRLDRLISDISDASRLDAQLSRSQMETVDLAGLVETLVDAYRSTGRDDVPTITYRAPEAEQFLVLGIESRLAQVIGNLIDNAVSFTPARGRLSISMERKGGQVRLCVEDEGPGLPDGATDKIFKRFYSERPESEAFGTHSGLGLSICKQIVEAHSGEIYAENRIESAPDGDRILGARFVVILPQLRRPE